ncbi:MAG: GDCCVxC domain-containing (seleno)protein [Pseudomonadota bacterium]
MNTFSPTLESLISCPHCGHARLETMPEDSCQWFYECLNCHAVLKPQPGDCCVFCSYGSVPCPPIQQNRATRCC